MAGKPARRFFCAPGKARVAGPQWMLARDGIGRALERGGRTIHMSRVFDCHGSGKGRDVLGFWTSVAEARYRLCGEPRDFHTSRQKRVDISDIYGTISIVRVFLGDGKRAAADRVRRNFFPVFFMPWTQGVDRRSCTAGFAGSHASPPDDAVWSFRGKPDDMAHFRGLALPRPAAWSGRLVRAC